MAACPEYEVLLDVHATGGLEAEEAARVQAHVKSCDGCRAALASTVQLLGLAELPPLSAEEKAEVQELPRRTLSAWRRDAQHHGLRRRTLGSLAAAAAVVALMLLVPGRLHLFPGGAGTVTTPRTTTPTEASVSSTEVDPEAMAEIEAWAGLEPLDDDTDGLADDADLDEDLNFDLGETL
ncbi:zf-HC2 domain-containing protein [Pyxidicoccus parkwayensis]|uniref:Zf-HC2 domain-containing protein n=1 Tax=Pyxidicoccus parkwayensis TaxID=2813578 RepID=A0ABX7NJB5_9BACT|nr:zf-HC2 domain-containing protein [Pyxidicoccus parkwaysis]QSQ18738.1 zf-HC2 domain-containing protein [Pyxidicoccus parkwaysis]